MVSLKAFFFFSWNNFDIRTPFSDNFIENYQVTKTWEKVRRIFHQTWAWIWTKPFWIILLSCLFLAFCYIKVAQGTLYLPLIRRAYRFERLRQQGKRESIFSTFLHLLKSSEIQFVHTKGLSHLCLCRRNNHSVPQKYVKSFIWLFHKGNKISVMSCCGKQVHVWYLRYLLYILRQHVYVIGTHMLLYNIHVWAGPQHFLQQCMCVQRRLRSTCASTQADKVVCPLKTV